MLSQRVLVSLLLLPVGLVAVYFGGVAYLALIALILGLAAWEYNRLFRAGGYQPASAFVIGGVLLIVFGRAWNQFESAPWILSLLILAAMLYHLLAYEKGRIQAATDFGVSMGGILYLGWIGAYLISIRQVEYGAWWVFLALPTIWIVDSAAYIFGTRYGKHHLTLRLSPKKTWEGYWGGAIVATLGGALLAAILKTWFAPASGITVGRGAFLGVILGTMTIFGDLGESMIKRQAGAKDSSRILPGHGGVFDRIDSWLWGAVLAYYVIVFAFRIP